MIQYKHMDNATRRMHLRAGYAYGRDATCGPPEKPKQKYHTEETAADAAVRMSTQYGRDLEHYPCYWCGDWHIGRTMTQEERDQYSVDEHVGYEDMALMDEIAANSVADPDNHHPDAVELAKIWLEYREQNGGT
jgi:hypothetical protein